MVAYGYLHWLNNVHVTGFKFIFLKKGLRKEFCLPLFHFCLVATLALHL